MKDKRGYYYKSQISKNNIGRTTVHLELETSS